MIIISAHPDDETLGAGGTILRHKRQGDNVVWINVTSIFEYQGFTLERINSRSNEIKKIINSYSFDESYNLGYPTMTLTSEKLPSIIKDLSNIFQRTTPNIIYCPNRSDAHSDHRLLYEAVMACTKVFRYPSINKVLMYECLSETEFAPQMQDSMFLPNYFVNITEYLEKKLSIMEIYTSELGDHPFPRSLESIKALATLRGAMAGVKYAEAFQVVKIIT